MFRGKRLITYVITNSKHAPAYIDIEPEFLVCLFVFVLCVMKLTGLVDREGGVDVWGGGPRRGCWGDGRRRRTVHNL